VCVCVCLCVREYAKNRQGTEEMSATEGKAKGVSTPGLIHRLQTCLETVFT
jgi:hypothetical protein